MSVQLCSGRELQQQVAQLQAEYLRVGDQLESEQTRIMQVPANTSPATTCILTWNQSMCSNYTCLLIVSLGVNLSSNKTRCCVLVQFLDFDLTGMCVCHAG